MREKSALLDTDLKITMLKKFTGGLHFFAIPDYSVHEEKLGEIHDLLDFLQPKDLNVVLSIILDKGPQLEEDQLFQTIKHVQTSWQIEISSQPISKIKHKSGKLREGEMQEGRKTSSPEKPTQSKRSELFPEKLSTLIAEHLADTIDLICFFNKSPNGYKLKEWSMLNALSTLPTKRERERAVEAVQQIYEHMEKSENYTNRVFKVVYPSDSLDNKFQGHHSAQQQLPQKRYPSAGASSTSTSQTKQRTNQRTLSHKVENPLVFVRLKN